MKTKSLILEQIRKYEPDYSKIPGGVRLTPSFRLFKKNQYEFAKKQELMEGATLVSGAISEENCDRMIEFFESQGTYAPVTIQGMQDVSDDANIGSRRITGFSPELADDIFESIFTAMQGMKVCDHYTATDWWQDGMHERWVLEGCSPLLRFMEYQRNGKHFPHYDAGFIYPKTDDLEIRTLKSFVLYLTSNQTGATRFIKDGQENIPVFDRNHDDWDREPTQAEIIHRVLPVKGDMLVFDHRMCHDVETYNDPVGDRIIIRGDLIYKAV